MEHEVKRAIRWVPDRGEYEDFRVPDGASTYEYDLSCEVACALCGEPVEFGKSYTSRFVHNDLGFGYAVCPGCYGAEIEGARRAHGV